MPNAPEKIAILGGGISSLWTAFELTQPYNKDKYDVTIYQMGWRLGGKLASSSNGNKQHRNEEHGIHVWFGSYANAFTYFKQAYRELKQFKPEYRWDDYLDVFSPFSRTPVGNNSRTGTPWWDFAWPPGFPDAPGGKNYKELTPPEYVKHSFSMLRHFVNQHLEESSPKPITKPLEFEYRELIKLAKLERGFILSNIIGKIASEVDTLSVDGLLNAIEHCVLSAIEHESSASAAHVGIVQKLIDVLRRLLLFIVGFDAGNHPDDHLAASLIDIGVAAFSGIINPKYKILPDFNFSGINHLDVREFLKQNGATNNVVSQSSLLRAWYDVPFQYRNGQLGSPSYAAGSSFVFALWLGVTYRQQFGYLAKGGFGDAVIAPIYAALKQRGVKFEFFHKVKDLTLTPTNDAVATIRFEKQVNLKGGDSYDPIEWRNDKKLFSWPAEPFWNQIIDGDQMAKNHVNWESHWNQWKPAGETVIESGTHFDKVVLGIALGAFKNLNSSDRSICQSLIDANPQFQQMTENLEIVGTLSAQFWFTEDFKGLGWNPPLPLSGGGFPEPFNVWTTMSDVIETEGWRETPPRGLAYLCGPYDSSLYRVPTSDATVPNIAFQQAFDTTKSWTEKHGASTWPGTGTGLQNGQFNWDVLFNPTANDIISPDSLLGEQYIRANIDPTECIVASFENTIQYRKLPNESGFKNLFLTGAWTNTSINVTCVEGATIAAKRCARAITGNRKVPEIIGEDFLNAQQ